MKSVGGAGLVVIGLLFLYLAITGKMDCFFNFISCITSGGLPGTTATGSASGSTGGNGINWGQLINQYGGQIIGGITGSGGGTSSVPSTSPFGTAPHVG